MTPADPPLPSPIMEFSIIFFEPFLNVKWKINKNKIKKMNKMFLFSVNSTSFSLVLVTNALKKYQIPKGTILNISWTLGYYINIVSSLYEICGTLESDLSFLEISISWYGHLQHRLYSRVDWVKPNPV